MKSLTGQLLLLLLLALTISAQSQSVKRPSFRATIRLKEGGSISGVPLQVQNGILEFAPFERIYYRHTEYGKGSVSLARAEAIIIKRTDKKHAVRNGWFIGGALGAYVAIRGYQRNPFRSPVLGGITVAATTAVFGAAGGLTGKLVGSTSRVTLRPLRSEDATESLERQLRPFTKAYLDTLKLDVQ